MAAGSLKEEPRPRETTLLCCLQHTLALKKSRGGSPEHHFANFIEELRSEMPVDLGQGRSLVGALIQAPQTEKIICRRKPPNTTRRHQNISRMPHGITEKPPSTTIPENTQWEHTTLTQRGAM